MYPKRSFQPQPVPARFAWFATLVVGLCQFPLSSPLRESISQAWIDKLSGHPTETRTPISTLKGWPPSQLEDGTLCDFSVSRSVGLPVSGLKSVQSFGLAQIFHAMVDLGLSTSPNQNPFLVFLRLPTYIMAEILCALRYCCIRN